MWPHRFGQTWSSRKQSAAPAAISSATVPPGSFDQLGLGQQAHVRLADGSGGDKIAGDEGHREAGAVREFGPEGVEDAGEGDRADLLQDAVDARDARDAPRE
jgi:hypothetical protein